MSANALGALADPTRRAILELVAERPRPVGELAQVLPVSRPAVSQHLKVLRDAGLTQQVTHGSRHIDQLDPAGLAALRAYLDRFWTTALTSFKEVAEQSPQEQR